MKFSRDSYYEPTIMVHDTIVVHDKRKNIANGDIPYGY